MDNRELGMTAYTKACDLNCMDVGTTPDEKIGCWLDICRASCSCLDVLEPIRLGFKRWLAANLDYGAQPGCLHCYSYKRVIEHALYFAYKKCCSLLMHCYLLDVLCGVVQASIVFLACILSSWELQ